MLGYNDRSQCDCLNYQTFSFYDNYEGKDEIVEHTEPSALPMIVMTLSEGSKYSGVPEKEIKRLIEEKKIHSYKSNMGIIVWYTDMKSIKYWWKVYLDEKKKIKERP